MLKKILQWIKAMVSKISALLPHRSGSEPAPERNIKLERKLGKEIARGRGRGVSTAQGGPNMPKSQPCPKCHGKAKRDRKTVGGAFYDCPRHGEFFVRAPIFIGSVNPKKDVKKRAKLPKRLQLYQK